jgi:hypothetical protein
MKRKYLVWAAYAVVAIGLVVGSFAAGYFATGTRVASAQPAVPAGPNAADASLWCTLGNVATFSSRMHIWCSNAQTVGSDTVYYYAYPLGSSYDVQANRFIASAYTAWALGKSLAVYYDTNSANNPTGCWTGDCRLLTGVFVQ